MDDIDVQLANQRRFVADQGEEKQRVNKRFDAELAQLKVLWGQLEPAPAARAPAKAP